MIVLFLLLGLSGCASNQTTIEGYLLDGTPFRIQGVTTSNVQPMGLEGVIMVENSSEPASALGEVVYSHVQGQDAKPQVTWLNDQLRVIAGDWFMGVNIYPQHLDRLGKELIARAVVPTLVDGFLTVDFSPPLRWQDPWEVPANIGIRYADFALTVGCASLFFPNSASPADVICSEDGALGFNLFDWAVGSGEYSNVRIESGY